MAFIVIAMYLTASKGVGIVARLTVIQSYLDTGIFAVKKKKIMLLSVFSYSKHLL